MKFWTYHLFSNSIFHSVIMLKVFGGSFVLKSQSPDDLLIEQWFNFEGSVLSMNCLINGLIV